MPLRCHGITPLSSSCHSKGKACPVLDLPILHRCHSHSRVSIVACWRPGMARKVENEIPLSVAARLSELVQSSVRNRSCGCVESYQSYVAASPPKFLSLPKDSRMYSIVLCRGVSSSPSLSVAALACHCASKPASRALSSHMYPNGCSYAPLKSSFLSHKSHNLWLSCKYDYLQCLQGIIKSLFWSSFKCIISIKVICCSDYHFISIERKKKDAKKTSKLYMIQWTFCFKWNIQISFEKAWFGCRSELSFPYSTSSLHFSEDWVPFYGFPSLV